MMRIVVPPEIRDVGVDELPANAYLNAWMHYNVLNIINPGDPGAIVELYNIHGQVILRREIGQGLQTIPVHVTAGAYVVMLRTDHTLATRKLVVQ
ncbi:MAG: T9SS type A sorting domain-containing protein [Bacteroidales bacterium]|nr:T9SS type A sorting domain-containing protein [Bacteroidales bacterium]